MEMNRVPNIYRMPMEEFKEIIISTSNPLNTGVFMTKHNGDVIWFRFMNSHGDIQMFETYPADQAKAFTRIEYTIDWQDDNVPFYLQTCQHSTIIGKNDDERLEGEQILSVDTFEFPRESSEYGSQTAYKKRLMSHLKKSKIKVYNRNTGAKRIHQIYKFMDRFVKEEFREDVW